MEKLVRKISFRDAERHAGRRLQREWLVTNGLGGYASGTISGSVTWRFHGLLIAALPAPLGRMLMFNHMAEFLEFEGDKVIQLGGDEPQGPGDDITSEYLTEFRLENGLPFWRYETNGTVVEKRTLLTYGQNTVHVTYKLLSENGSAEL